MKYAQKQLIIPKDKQSTKNVCKKEHASNQFTKETEHAYENLDFKTTAWIRVTQGNVGQPWVIPDYPELLGIA